MSNNMLARINRAVESDSATILLARIHAWSLHKKGGNVIDGRRYSFRSVAEWGEECGFSARKAERALAKLEEANLVERRMAWVGKSFVLHVRPTERAQAIINGAEEDAEGAPDLAQGDHQNGGAPCANFGAPGTPNLALLYINPETYLETNPENLPFGQSPDEPPTSSSAEKISEEKIEAEGNFPVKPVKTFPKSALDVKNHVKKTSAAILHKPDTTAYLVKIWRTAKIAWNAASGKPAEAVNPSKAEEGALRSLATAAKSAQLTANDVIEFGVRHWMDFVEKHAVNVPADKGKLSAHPTIFSLWTMRETIANQLHSSKTPKKQEAVASSIPSTQLTAIYAPAPVKPPEPPKLKLTKEQLKAIEEKYK